MVSPYNQVQSWTCSRRYCFLQLKIMHMTIIQLLLCSEIIFIFLS